MLEVYIECWSNDDGTTYPWSLWRDGKQVFSSHGRTRYDDADAAEHDALRFCSETLKRSPDALTRL